MEEKLKMIDMLYKNYNIRFPYKAKYKRDSNRIYFAGDFRDGEEVTFWWNCGKPSACAIGNAFYINNKGNQQLINIKELESLD